MTEIAGPRHNKRIVDYLETVDLAAQFKRDETPWCSAFVNFCMPRGFRTDSALARSWMIVGGERWSPGMDTTLTGREGDICVFYDKNSEYKGHVGFFIAFNKKMNKVLVLGGNQSNSVSYQWYPVNGNRLYLRSVRRI